MKHLNHSVSSLLGLLALLPALGAAEATPAAAKEERKQLRILTGPEHDRRTFGPRGERAEGEKESVTYLGVWASTVPAALSAQLGLPRDTGLVVGQVAPKSPVADVLKEHDILLRFDDQILIDPRQLSVLVRNHQEGDEVTLTYLRGGQKATAKVKLGKHDVPKAAVFERMTPGPGTTGFRFESDGRMEMAGPLPEGLQGRENWDRVLSLLQRARPAPDGGPGYVPPGARIRIEHGNGPGVRAMSINAGSSNLIFTDDDGTLELTFKDGAKTLVAKGPKGEAVFSGPATTPEERQAIPARVRERLEKLEGMHDITFRTDGDFKPAESKVIRPRAISYPPAPERRPFPSARQFL